MINRNLWIALSFLNNSNATMMIIMTAIATKTMYSVGMPGVMPVGVELNRFVWVILYEYSDVRVRVQLECLEVEVGELGQVFSKGYSFEPHSLAITCGN